MTAVVRLIGLGKLGLPLAALFASAGCRVVGIDTSRALVESLRNGAHMPSEPGLEDLIAAAGGNLTFHTENQADRCDAAIVQVPTPSKSSAPEFESTFVERATHDACRAAVPHLSRGDRHLIVIASTLMPGTMEQLIEPMIRDYSDRSEGTILCAYVPDLVAIGEVIRDFRRPPVLLVGANDPEAQRMAVDLYGLIVDADVPRMTTNTREAELAKVAWNFYFCMRIEYANMIARMADHWGGMNVDRVLGCIGHDERIGAGFLKPGMPFGGPCLPRDVDAMIALCGRHERQTGLAESIARGNRHHFDHIIEKLCESGPETVAVLGLGFKAGTAVTTGSPSFLIIERLLERRTGVVVFDPYPQSVEAMSKMEWAGAVVVAEDLKDACARADAILVAVDDRQLSTVGDEAAAEVRIIDPWGCVAGNHPGLVRLGGRD